MPRRSGTGRVLATYQSSRGAGEYEIREGADGVVYCTCTGWRMRRTCRHLTDWTENGGRGASGYVRDDGVSVRTPRGHGPITTSGGEVPAPRSHGEAMTADNIMDQLTRRSYIRGACHHCGDTVKFEGEGNWRCVNCNEVQGFTAEQLINHYNIGGVRGLRRRQNVNPTEISAVTADIRARNRQSWQGPAVPRQTGGVKYWNVYEAGKLVGKVTGASKADVLGMFIRTSGSATAITVTETR